MFPTVLSRYRSIKSEDIKPLEFYMIKQPSGIKPRRAAALHIHIPLTAYIIKTYAGQGKIIQISHGCASSVTQDKASEMNAYAVRFDFFLNRSDINAVNGLTGFYSI